MTEIELGIIKKLKDDIASAIETNAIGKETTPEFSTRLEALGKQLSLVIRGYAGFILDGVDKRTVLADFGCSRQALDWFIEKGWFPGPEGKVLSYEWRSCGKYTVDIIVA